MYERWQHGGSGTCRPDQHPHIALGKAYECKFNQILGFPFRGSISVASSGREKGETAFGHRSPFGMTGPVVGATAAAVGLGKALPPALAAAGTVAVGAAGSKNPAGSAPAASEAAGSGAAAAASKKPAGSPAPSAGAEAFPAPDTGGADAPAAADVLDPGRCAAAAGDSPGMYVCRPFPKAGLQAREQGQGIQWCPGSARVRMGKGELSLDCSIDPFTASLPSAWSAPIESTTSVVFGHACHKQIEESFHLMRDAARLPSRGQL